MNKQPYSVEEYLDRLLRDPESLVEKYVEHQYTNPPLRIPKYFDGTGDGHHVYFSWQRNLEGTPPEEVEAKTEVLNPTTGQQRWCRTKRYRYDPASKAYVRFKGAKLAVPTKKPTRVEQRRRDGKEPRKRTQGQARALHVERQRWYDAFKRLRAGETIPEFTYRSGGHDYRAVNIVPVTDALVEWYEQYVVAFLGKGRRAGPRIVHSYPAKNGGGLDMYGDGIRGVACIDPQHIYGVVTELWRDGQCIHNSKET